MRAFAYVASLLLVAGCGGDTGLNTNPDMAKSPDMAKAPPDMSATPDMAMPPPVDMAYDPPKDADGVQCGQMMCKVGETCCVSAQNMMPMAMCVQGACADGGVAVVCDGPEDCMGNPCCATLTPQGVGNIMCEKAQNDCPPNFNIQGMTGQTRFCHIDGDCTAGAPNTTLPLCCTVQDQQGNQAHICLNQQFAQFAGGHCP